MRKVKVKYFMNDVEKTVIARGDPRRFMENPTVIEVEILPQD